MYKFHVGTCEYIYDTFAGNAGMFEYGGFPSVCWADNDSLYQNLIYCS